MEKNSNQILWNGEWVSEEQLADGLNRAFRYGDGLFESMRLNGGEIPLIEYHFDRLFKGMHALKIEPVNNFKILLKESLEKLVNKQKLDSAIIRLWVFRGGKGKYTPSSNQAAFCLQAEPLNSEPFTLNSKGLRIEIVESIQLHKHPFSAFKTLNALPYVRASIEKKERGFDDLILLDQNGRLSEATSSNLFLIKNNRIKTPPIEAACVNGVMRTFLLNDKKLTLPIVEEVLELDDLLLADEVFLANSIQGIKWVGAFRDKRYFHHQTEILSKYLDRHFSK